MSQLGLALARSELPWEVNLTDQRLTENDLIKNFGENGIYKSATRVDISQSSFQTQWLKFLPRNLKSLKFRGLFQEDFAMIIEELKHFEALIELDLSSTQDNIPTHGSELSHEHFGFIALQSLAQSAHLKSLKTLHLQYRYIDDVGAHALAQSPYLTSLKGLNVNGNSIQNEGVQALTQSSVLKPIQELNLGWNNIGNAGLPPWPGP